ncbi:MAG: hypothetical protein P8N19_09110 [Flavobacteriales bacterium]|nr:hypothetical protein [Flavobacteriales bacterium]MDG1767715.1 hypothetical protein [Flavobacteriales bacterium]
MSKKQIILYAIIVTLLVHAIALVVLAYQKVDYGGAEEQFIEVDFLGEVASVQEEVSLEDQIADRLNEQIANLMANANAELSEERSSYSVPSEKMSRDVEDDLKRFESEEFERLQREREAEDQTSAPSNPENAPSKNEPLDNYDYFGKSFNGNVTALADVPGRNPSNIHIPGYLCKGGGKVVLNVIVDQEGYVTSAIIGSGSTTTDQCLLDEAVNSALKSKFAAKSAAPKKSPGTIVYRFIPQG